MNTNKITRALVALRAFHPDMVLRADTPGGRSVRPVTQNAWSRVGSAPRLAVLLAAGFAVGAGGALALSPLGPELGLVPRFEYDRRGTVSLEIGAVAGRRMVTGLTALATVFGLTEGEASQFFDARTYPGGRLTVGALRERLARAALAASSPSASVAA